MIIKNQLKPISLSILTLLVFFITGCKQPKKSEYIHIEGVAQGTTYHMTYESADGKNYHSEIDSILRDFDKAVSVYIPKSVISRINNNESGVEVSAYFEDVFKRSQEISQLTDGAFDVTVAPLVEAWGFGMKKQQPLDSNQVDSLKSIIGYKRVRLQGKQLVKDDQRMALTFDAIAQGYSVDVISKYLESKGITTYLVEIGGEVFAKGVNAKGEQWKIGIDKPQDNSDETNRELQAVVHLSGKALATSGSYRKFYVKNGIKYSHTIDPKTGYPVSHNLLSASVLAPDCMTADAIATAFMVFGLDKSIAFLKTHPNLEAFFIYSDPAGKFQVYSTKGFEKIVVK